MIRNHQRLLAYGVAIGSTAIALLLSLWLEPLISRTMGVFFYIAIVVTTWYGGFRPGMVTVILSALIIDYLFIFPQSQFWIKQPEKLLRLSIFLLVALVINLLTSNLQHSRQKIKQLSQKLAQENAEQLRMALSAAQMGLWDWDIVTGEIKLSPEHEQLFGLAVGSFDGRYETYNAHLHPEDRQAANQAIQQALQTESTYQHEYRIIWADGSIHWIEVRGNGFYNEAGKPVRMTGTVMDIDDRKRSEADRKQAQEKLQQQFEQQRLVMEMSQRIRRSLNLQEILQTTVDEVRQFLECDRVIIFQFSPGWGGTILVESVTSEWMSILALQIYDPCIGEENVEPFKKALVTAKADIYTAGISPCHIEFLASLQVRANLVIPILKGDELWGLLTAHHCAAPREWQSSEIDLLRQLGAQVSIAIQQAALFQQVQTELAERKQMEAALSQSERRYRSLVHASSQIVWRTDPEGNTITAPEGWEELTGQPAIEYLGLGWFNVVHPDDRPHTIQRWQESYINPTLYETEYRLCMKDGNYRDFAVRGVPILDADEKITEWIGTCTDITERKKAQIALRQSEERYRTLFESIDEGFCIIEMLFDQNHKPLDYRFLEINPAFEKQTGLEQAVGKTVRQLVPNLEDYWFEVYGQVALTGESIRFEHGSQAMNRWFDVYALRVGQPSSRKVAVVFKDITRRKQAQIALQQLNTELEQRVAERTAQMTQTNDRLLATVIEQQKTQLILLEQAQLLDLAHDTIITRDLNGAISFWNQGAESMYGWTKAEALGQILHSLLKSQFSQPLTEIQAQLLEKGYWEGELTHFRRDNQPVNVASRWVLQKDNAGKPIKILEINNDITDRKGIEDALRNSEEKFRQLAENIQAVFWIKDIRTHQVIYVSNAYQTIWQSSCEELYRNHSNWLDAIHPEDRQRVEIEFIEKFRTGQYDNKYRIIRPDGSIRWIRDRAFPIKNQLGELVRIAGIAEDVTELQQIDLMKSEFIGIVSHELRTPLTAIRAALGLLQTGIYDKKPDKFKRMIEIAAIDSDRLVRLVNDILDLERLESGGAVLEKTTCNAVDLIQQAVGGLQAIAKQQNITFDIHPTNAQVWAAADTIIQTLTNLLGNAIKFSPADSTITLSVQQQTDRVRFQITDQGRGIPTEKLEAIFGRFQQVDASDSRTKGGTGLGLAICRSIIDQHGGQIWAESTISVGTTFFFTLPLPPEDIK